MLEKAFIEGETYLPFYQSEKFGSFLKLLLGLASVSKHNAYMNCFSDLLGL